MTVSLDNDLNAISGGGATVGGSDTEVQFNDGGALGGDAGLTYNKTTNVLTNTGGNIVNSQAVAATSTDGLVLQTSSTATAGAQKYSPRLRLRGSGWKTDATAAAQAVDWIAEVVPVQGTATPKSKLVFSYSVNGGAYTEAMNIDNQFGINVVTAAYFSPTSGVYLNATELALNPGGVLKWNGIAEISVPATHSVRFGSATANPPNAKTLSVQNASGTDIAGAAWTHIASLGTGAGAPGTMVFQTGATLGSGTTLQTATTRFTIAETRLTAAVPVVLPSYTVGTLPTGAAGMVAFVTDANATTFASIVAGGGANGVPVYHDGTNWRIG